MHIFVLLNTEISWLPHFPSIKDCLCLIKFILRCLYIEDGNRFMFSTEINKLNETGSWHCKTRNQIGLLNTDCWLVIFLDNKYTEEHLIEKYLHENSLILVTETKVNNFSICISIANVHISVYLFSIDILKFSKKICIG